MENKYRNYNGFWIYAGEPHTEKCLNKSQVKEILKHGGFGIRNSFNFDKSETGKFWYVINDKFVALEEMPSPKVRNQIRKSLNNYDIQLIPQDYLMKHGYRVLCEASSRYENFQLPNKDEFKKEIEDLTKARCDIWGCIRKETGVLDAYAINGIYDDDVEYWTMKADLNSAKNLYPFYGLIYVMNEYYLRQNSFSYVCDGARSITGHSNIQPFLIDKFGFRCAYADLKIYYRAPLGLIVKALFPFRKWIHNKKVKAILNMEAMCSNK